MTLKAWVCGFLGYGAGVSLSLQCFLHCSCISVRLHVELDLGPNLAKNKLLVLPRHLPARLVSQIQFTMQ